MPAIYTYRVRRTQEVIVRAATPQKAHEVAEAYFEGLAISTDRGNITRGSQTTDVSVKQES